MRVITAMRRSLVAKLLLPVCGGLGLAAVTGAVYLYLQSSRTIEAQALQTARAVASQIAQDRGHYAKEMEAKSLDPMFLHEIGTQVNREGLYRVALLGLWPVNPKHAARDEFERGAMQRLLADPTLELTRVHTADGQPVLALIRGETAALQMCVECHDAQLGGKGHQLKDKGLMGALVVEVPIGAALAGARAAAGVAMGALFLALLAIGAGVTAVAWRVIRRPVSRLVSAVGPMAEGDFSHPIPLSSEDELGRIGAALEATRTRISDVLGTVAGTIAAVRGVSHGLAGRATQLSAGAQEQASSLEETAASLAEITSTVKQSADNAKQANQVATGARSAAEQGGTVVQAAMGAMTAITASSKQISAIISTIDEIAFQTNLLALNAAVEAARAGDQGRAFAVVASEVRALAQRSALSSREIKALISDSVAKVEDGAKLVNQAGSTLTEIVAGAKKVADLIAEISAASGEQSLGIEQVNQAVSSMETVTQENAAQTEELSSSARSLATQAEALAAQVAQFTLAQGADPAPAISSAIASRGPSGTSSHTSVAKPTAARAAFVKVATGTDRSEEF